mmetsp:Transcript_21520/g.62683  ORF Transcript_21520/g.62683 Transcript_21520/m.62683 type:complete len:247 (-) Transcript_21520:16-756(-)
MDDVISRESVEALALVQVPEHGDGVLAARGAERAIRGHGDRVQVALVAHEVTLELEVGEVPHLDLLVPAARHDDRGRLGRGEADAGHPLGVALVNGELAFAEGVPELDGLVPGPGDDLPVVRRERHGQHILLMANKALGGHAGNELPEAQGAVPGAGEGELGVGGEHDAGHEVGVAAQGTAGEAEALLGALNLPDDHGLVPGGRQDGVIVVLGSGNARDPVGVRLEGAAESELLSHGQRGQWTAMR